MLGALSSILPETAFLEKNIRQRLGIDAEELIVVFFTDLSMRALSRCRCRLFAGPRRHRGKPSIAQTTKLLKRHQLSTVKHLTILCLTSPLPRVSFALQATEKPKFKCYP